MNLRDIAALIKVVKLFVVFKLLFKRAQHIPTWLVSYNDRSYPDIKHNDRNDRTIQKMLGLNIKKYTNGRGGKGSVAGSSEILLICTPKIKE